MIDTAQNTPFIHSLTWPVYLPIGFRRRVLTEPQRAGQGVQADQADRTQPRGSAQSTRHDSAWAGGSGPASSRQSSRLGRTVAPALLQERPRLRRPSPQVRPRGNTHGDQSAGSQRTCLQLAASSGHGRTWTRSGQRSPPCRAVSRMLRSRRCVSIRRIPPPPSDSAVSAEPGGAAVAF
jgi:hypothetical protein